MSREQTIEELTSLLGPLPTLEFGRGQIRVATLTPEMCDKILRFLNTSNIRKNDRSSIVAYATDMAAGLWQECYDPVVFVHDWTLYNGQTRCAATVRAQVPMSAVVVTGAHPNTRASIDGGRKRTIVQTHDVHSHVASMVAVVMLLERGSASTEGITRSAIAAEFDLRRELFEFYSSLFLKRPVLREAHVAATFAFAEMKRKGQAEKIRGIAIDIASGPQESAAAKLIAGHVVARKQQGVRVSSQAERLAEAVMFLQVIQATLLGKPVSPIGETSPIGKRLAWWGSQS